MKITFNTTFMPDSYVWGLIALIIGILCIIINFVIDVIRVLWWVVWIGFVLGVLWLWITEPQTLHGIVDWVKLIFNQPPPTP